MKSGLGLLLLAGLASAGSAWGQFDLEESHTTASLRGIHALGAGVAWASGANGTVLRTEDGGYLWQPCTVPKGAEKLDFRGVQAFDANTAVVMASGKGPASRIYKTTDGCQTWKLVFENPDAEGFFDVIKFASPPSIGDASARGGVLIGDPVNGKFVIYTSYDQGDTWTDWIRDAYWPSKAIYPAKAARDESLFAASNGSAVVPGSNIPFAFVTGGKGGPRLFVPEPHSPLDNGTTWEFRSIVLPMSSGASAGAFAVERRAKDATEIDLVIVGGDYSKPDAAGSAAFISGKERSLFGSPSAVKAKTPPHGYRSAVAWDAQHEAWLAVGPNGADVSYDDGKNWRSLPGDTAAGWNAVSLPFVVGANGRIGKLRDGVLKP